MDYTQYLLVCEYIIKVLRTMAFGEPLADKPDSVKWGEVYAVAKSHSFAGTLFYFLEDVLKSEAEGELLSQWERDRDFEFLKDRKQKEEFSRITELFTKEKLSFLPLKGFMMKALYPKSVYRFMVDMDIYVSVDGIERAKELLVGIGYKEDIGYEVHDSMLKPPFVNIELHKLIFEKTYGTEFGEFVPKKDNPYWYEMTDEDFYVYLIRHAHKHYSNTGGCGIRSVLDLYLYERANPLLVDSEGVIKKLREGGLYDFYLDLKALSLYWFASVKPERDISDFEGFILLGGTYGNIKNRVSSEIKGKNKFAYALSKIFVPKSIIYARFKWTKKCPVLLPFGYIARLFTSLFDGRAREYVDAINESGKREKTKQNVKKQNTRSNNNE